MEAVLQKFYQANTVPINRTQENIYVPTPGKQSLLWWLWSCVTAQQTLFPNLIYFYTCQPLNELKKETIAVSATLSRSFEQNIYVFERRERVAVGDKDLVLLFLTKKEYVKLLGKLQKDRAANETPLKCQSWLIPPNHPRKIMLDSPEDEVDDAIRLCFERAIQPYRTGTLRAVLVRQEVGKTGTKLADEILLVTESLSKPPNAPDATEQDVRFKCKAFINANMAAWEVAELLLAEADKNYTSWELVKLSPRVHGTLRVKAVDYSFRQCVVHLKASLTYRTHEFLKVLPAEYNKGSQRLIKAVIIEEYLYGEEDEEGRRQYPVDGYDKILQLYDGDPVDFLSLL